MERKNMYRAPGSPSAVMRKLANINTYAVRPMVGRPAANQTGKMPPAGQSAPKGSAAESAMVNPEVNQPAKIKLDLKSFTKDNSFDSDPSIVSQEKLQDAIIWSEILGKPVSRRGKRRMSWQ